VPGGFESISFALRVFQFSAGEDSTRLKPACYTTISHRQFAGRAVLLKLLPLLRCIDDLRWRFSTHFLPHPKRLIQSRDELMSDPGSHYDLSVGSITTNQVSELLVCNFGLG